MEAIEIAGEHANGVVCANAAVDETSAPVVALKDELKRRYGSAPSSIFYTALGYDGLRILLQAPQTGKPFDRSMRELQYTGGVLTCGWI